MDLFLAWFLPSVGVASGAVTGLMAAFSVCVIPVMVIARLVEKIDPD